MGMPSPKFYKASLEISFCLSKKAERASPRSCVSLRGVSRLHKGKSPIKSLYKVGSLSQDGTFISRIQERDQQLSRLGSEEAAAQQDEYNSIQQLMRIIQTGHAEEDVLPSRRRQAYTPDTGAEKKPLLLLG